MHYEGIGACGRGFEGDLLDIIEVVNTSLGMIGRLSRIQNPGADSVAGRIDQEKIEIVDQHRSGIGRGTFGIMPVEHHP